MTLSNLICHAAKKSKSKVKSKVFPIIRILRTQTTTINNYEAALDYRSIPRPSIFKFIRHFMPGGEFRNASFFEYAGEMRKRFGDIYVLPGLFDKSDIVMVFNTKDFATVYRNEGQWPQREIFQSAKHFRENIRGDFFKETTGLPIAQGKQWGKMRSAVNPVLMKPQNLNIYIKPLQEISDEFVERLKEIRHPTTLEVPKDFDKEIYRLTFEAISLVALNCRLGFISQHHKDPDAECLIESTRLNFQLVYELDIQPSIWRYIRTPTYYRNIKVQENLLRITQKYINATLQRIEEEEKNGSKTEAVNSILEKLLIKDKTLAIVTAIDMLTAGVDATSTTLMAILLCLAKNPDKQRILREEVLKVMPTKKTQLNENNMKNLPYLRAVFKESLRYYPNGTGPLRTPVQDVVLSGYKIPKGTTVIMNANFLLKDEAFFPKPEEFLPERWLRNERSEKPKLDPFSYIPFGVGPRICVGKRLAELQIEVILMRLIRNFEIEFNYDASKPFKAMFLNTPGIPMRFTFKNIDY